MSQSGRVSPPKVSKRPHREPSPFRRPPLRPRHSEPAMVFRERPTLLGTYKEYLWEGKTPPAPFQVGPTCGSHSMEATVHGRYAVAYEKAGFRNLPFRRLSVQYMLDQAAVAANSLSASKVYLARACCRGDPSEEEEEEVEEIRNGGGLIDAQSYTPPHGLRGEGSWIPFRFLSEQAHPRFPVLFGTWYNRLQDVGTDEIEKVKECLKADGPVYGDFGILDDYGTDKDRCNHRDWEPHTAYKPSPAELMEWKTGKTTEKPSHAVCIVGYGTFTPLDGSPPIHYFIYRNAWGPMFGTDGCGRIVCDHVASVWVPIVPKDMIFDISLPRPPPEPSTSRTDAGDVGVQTREVGDAGASSSSSEVRSSEPSQVQSFHSSQGQLSLLLLKHPNVSRSPSHHVPSSQHSLVGFPVRYNPSVGRHMSNESDPSKGKLSKTKGLKVTLAGALRIANFAETRARTLEVHIEQLNHLAFRRAEEVQHTKMMLKFQEEEIECLELLTDDLVSADKYLVAEYKALTEEIQLLRSRTDRNPELMRFALENISLLEQLKLIEDFYEQGEQEKLLAEVSSLCDQLLKLLEGKEGYMVDMFPSQRGDFYEQGEREKLVVEISSLRDQVVHFQHHTLFVNRVGGRLCHLQLNTWSQDLGTDPLKHLERHHAEIKLLKADRDNWNTPFSIGTEGSVDISLRNEWRSDQIYLTVVGALRIENLAETIARTLEVHIEQLNHLAFQRAEEVQHAKMMLKFQEEEIECLELLADDSEEIQLLQARTDRNPELMRFALENISLLEQLKLIEDFYEQGEQEKLLAEVSSLYDQLLKVLEGKESYMVDKFASQREDFYEQGEREKLVVEISSLRDQLLEILVGKESYMLDKFPSQREDEDGSTAKELEECKTMNSKLIREVDELQSELCKFMNNDQAAIYPVDDNLSKDLEEFKEISKTSKVQATLLRADSVERNQLEDGFQQKNDDQRLGNALGLQSTDAAKDQMDSIIFLDAMECEQVCLIEELILLQVKLDQMTRELEEARVLSHHQIDLVREEVEIETATTIMHLREEVAALRHVFVG